MQREFFALAHSHIEREGERMSVKPGKTMVVRIIVVMISMILSLSIISGTSLVKIMIVNGEKYQNDASQQQLYDSLVSAPRGDIYDCNMSILATSSTAWTVYITPNGITRLKNKKKAENIRTLIAQNLAEILSLEYEKVYEFTKQNSYYVTVKKKIDKQTADQVRQFIADNKDLEITRYVGLEETSKRYYPNDSLASVVLGFVGVDDQGLAGLESYYDNTLTGVAGRVVAAKNAQGTDMPFTYEKVEEATKGKSLVLGIDSYIQYTCEKYLNIAVEENQIAERGAVIVMNVNTGEIKGLAVKGDFNPNEPFALSAASQAGVDAETDEEKKKTLQTELLNHQWRNKAVSDTYEPGSVFKIVTASIALEENLINENSSFNCTASLNVAGTIYHCHKASGHGTQNLALAMSNSCNPAFITIGQLAGGNTFSKYFKAFGLTEKTGVDLPGEATSNYHTLEKMGITELSSSSFGQTFNITPIQLITAAAATVNGGYLVQPHVVSKVINQDNKVVETVSVTHKRQVISSQTSATMRKLMEFVVQNGAKNGLVTGYGVGGKTGTSQKMSKILATGNERLYIGSYVGVAPIDNPEIAVFVMLDEPKGVNYYGGVISAPVGSKVMTDILPYMGYEPHYTESELKSLAISVPAAVGKDVAAVKNTLTAAKLTCRVVGSGQKVLRQLPAEGSTVRAGGVVILYTEEGGEQTATVPNFVGLSATDANTASANAGVNIEFSGNTTASGMRSYRQSINPGETVPAGTVVTVYFRDESVVDMG